MNIDPKYRFIIGVIVTVAIAVTGGTLNFSHLIPADWIPAATQLCTWIAFVGSSITTTISGVGMTTSNRIASAAAVEEVKSIVTTQAIANAVPSEKVVSK